MDFAFSENCIGLVTYYSRWYIAKLYNYLACCCMLSFCDLITKTILKICNNCVLWLQKPDKGSACATVKSPRQEALPSRHTGAGVCLSPGRLYSRGRRGFEGAPNSATG